MTAPMNQADAIAVCQAIHAKYESIVKGLEKPAQDVNIGKIVRDMVPYIDATADEAMVDRMQPDRRQWGDPEASAREDREIMQAFGRLWDRDGEHHDHDASTRFAACRNRGGGGVDK